MSKQINQSFTSQNSLCSLPSIGSQSLKEITMNNKQILNLIIEFKHFFCEWFVAKAYQFIKEFLDDAI